MPRKRTTPTLTLLPPAYQFFLMAGCWAPRRVPGWVAALQDADIEATLRAAWHEHGDTLTAMARAAGFVPWGATQRAPVGAAFDAWASRFLDEQTASYPGGAAPTPRAAVS
jgi:hypothetical protein